MRGSVKTILDQHSSGGSRGGQRGLNPLKDSSWNTKRKGADDRPARSSNGVKTELQTIEEQSLQHK